MREGEDMARDGIQRRRFGSNSGDAMLLVLGNGKGNVTGSVVKSYVSMW